MSDVSIEEAISTLTKMELTGYLRQKILDDASVKGRHIVIAWETRCKATYIDKSHMNSDQEEEDDIKLILHVAVSTATSTASCSLDTMCSSSSSSSSYLV